jgi:lauroyl/myristoyl acyltransferase
VILYRIAELGRTTAGRLPASLSYPLASAIGDTLYYFWSRGRRNMVKSIASIFHQDVNAPEVRRTARHCMRNVCKYCVDVLRYSYHKQGALENDIEIIGLKNLDSVLSEGKGAILVSFHMGNLDLGIRTLNKLGYPVNAIIHNPGSGQLDKFIQRLWARAGVKLISLKDVPSQLLAALRRNEVLALMIDSPRCEKGVMVRLGDKLVRMPSGAATLALRTGSKIIPCCLIRFSNTKFHGIIGRPIEFQPAGKLAEDTRELTQRTVQVLERMARLFADQWYVFHPLIKDNIP